MVVGFGRVSSWSAGSLKNVLLPRENVCPPVTEALGSSPSGIGEGWRPTGVAFMSKLA